ncbi:MAG: glycosyltransferase [Methanobacterium sp.]|uniref:glycosyltransferase n=1 Tax=Methanobacterium sp. TaxID=2164 RepID=UPI003D649E3F|nr:glycosyltransferase [Methanobacterium sp.]
MILTLILVIILYILSFLVIWQFVGYPALMAIIALRGDKKHKDYAYKPFVSILVPTFNEEKVIDERIKNLDVLDYPDDKYEIIVVDSGSEDKTREIVEKIIKNRTRNPKLSLLVEKERKGKASAINFGKKNSKGDIILVTDANTTFEENVLKEMMPHFEDPKIGTVGGKHTLPATGSSITSSNQFYLDLEFIMRKGEAALDSACLFHGEINAWRKDIVDADTRMLSEDLDMAIQIRRNGYKIEYEPKAVFYEPSPTTAEEIIIQKRRTSIGTIQTIFKHLNYWIPPKNYYSFLIFPSHKALVMFSPFILIAIPVLYLIIMDLNIIITNLILTLIIFALVFGILTYLKSKIIKNEASKSGFSIKSFPSIAYYVLLNEYLILLAWKDFIFGKYSVLWEKVSTTR